MAVDLETAKLESSLATTRAHDSEKQARGFAADLAGITRDAAGWGQRVRDVESR